MTDMDIQALVDNQLEAGRREIVRAYIEGHPAAQKRYAQLQQQKNLLKAWWENGQSH